MTITSKTQKPARSFPITLETSARDLARYLARNGVEVLEHSEPTDIEDGNVKLSPTMNVQVGSGYAVLYVVIRGRGDYRLRYFKLRTNGRDIIQDVRDAS